MLEDFHICSCCDGCVEEDGTNYAPPGHPTPNTNLFLNEGVLHVSRWDFHLPKYGNVRTYSYSTFVAISSFGVRIIKEMPGLVASGTHCIMEVQYRTYIVVCVCVCL